MRYELVDRIENCRNEKWGPNVLPPTMKQLRTVRGLRKCRPKICRTPVSRIVNAGAKRSIAAIVGWRMNLKFNVPCGRARKFSHPRAIISVNVETTLCIVFIGCSHDDELRLSSEPRVISASRRDPFPLPHRKDFGTSVHRRLPQAALPDAPRSLVSPNFHRTPVLIHGNQIR
jgi:hypothetical protein